MPLSFGLERTPRRPRHYFDFPTEVRSAVESFTTTALNAIDPTAFRQEADYVAAIAGRLIGTPYSGKHGEVSFRSTIVASRGKHSAEKQFGADWIITATVSDGSQTLAKAIVIQAKLGFVSRLSVSQCNELQVQIEKMKRLTKAPKVLEIPQVSGQREPRILSGDGLLRNRHVRAVPLAHYISSPVLTTLHGDTRPAFVRAVQDSHLRRLHVTARLEK